MKKTILLLFFISYSFLFAQTFTIAVIPDSQNYVNYETNHDSRKKYPINQSDYFFNQMHYIADNSVSNGGSIEFAVHVGDFVSHWGEKEIEWKKAAQGMELINGVVPFIAVPGNHDYDECITKENNKKRIDGNRIYTSYFGSESSFFKNKDWYISSFNQGMDSCCLIQIQNESFLFIGLEVEPSDEVLNWAQELIDKYPGIPTIVVTHEYISIDYDPLCPGNAAFLKHNYREGYPRNTPEQIWDKLISVNNQIFLVLCGHHFRGSEGESVRTDINKYGNKVYSLLSDFQGRKEYFDTLKLKGVKLNCGDGWLRLLEFDLSKSEIRVKTYSPLMKIYETDANSQFVISFDKLWNERFTTNER